MHIGIYARIFPCCLGMGPDPGTTNDCCLSFEDDSKSQIYANIFWSRSLHS